MGPVKNEAATGKETQTIVKSRGFAWEERDGNIAALIKSLDS